VPETRVERVLFGLGVAAIVAIAVLIYFARSGDSATNPSTTNRIAQPAPAAIAPAAKTSKESGPQAGQTETQTRPTSRSTGVTLELIAARAESWVEIRSGSAQGAILFAGIMEQGSEQSFRAPRLYARFGSAGSLDARVNDAELRLQPGTYSALITRGGLETVSAG
jgi:hypothetical protein